MPARVARKNAKRRPTRKLEYAYKPRARTLPHLELRHRRYVAVLEIPRELREQLGRVRFVKSLKTESATAAERRAGPIIVAWKRQIEAARGRNEVDSDAAFFREALRDAKTEIERAHVQQLAEARANEIGLHELMEGDGSRDALKLMREFESHVANGPFDELVSEWHATSDVTAKTMDMQRADIKRFAAKFPTIASVSKGAVKEWTERLRAEGLTVKTVQRILSALRGYWEYLQARALAPAGERPFHDLGLPGTKGRKKKGRVRREDRRQEFTPQDVVRLMAEARSRDDGELADLIDMGRWTGARIEELCSLTVESVKLAAKVPHFTINAGKTDAAIRDVPIHPKLKPVLRRLIGERTTGYVFEHLSENKYHDRSNAIGKRFGYLKTALGFNDQFVFHSVRKTVASQLKDGGVPEFVAADIIGHEITTMSYGLYAGNVSLATKAEAIGKLRYPLAQKSPGGAGTR